MHTPVRISGQIRSPNSR